MTVSNTVRDFLRRYIRSVWELELLIFLSQTTGYMTALEIAKRMYVSPHAVDLALERFEADGLVKKDGLSPKAFIYSPRTDDLREIVKLCSRTYSDQRINVIEMIFQTSPNQS